MVCVLPLRARAGVCCVCAGVTFLSGSVAFLLCLGRPKKLLGDLHGSHVTLFLSTGSGEGGEPGLVVLNKTENENGEATYLELTEF